MAKSRAQKITGSFAELTGRTDHELRLGLTVAAVLAGLCALLRFVNFLANLGARFRSR